jgi:hypothetical protein
MIIKPSESLAVAVETRIVVVLERYNNIFG